MAHEDFKDLNRRTAAAHKLLHDKACDFAKSPKYDRYQCGLASMLYKCFDKKTSGWTAENETITNKELAEDLHKLIISRFEKRKVNWLFIDNIWGEDLADMQLISKFNKGFRFLLCVDIYINFVWVIAFKYTKGITIINAFSKFFRWIKLKTK